MCDQELLLDYLYGELEPAARQAFDRHLASCGDCRSEVEGLQGTRQQLARWAPPEPDLGFQIVRSAKPAPVLTSSRWRVARVWGLAAAALVVLGVSASLANLQITMGSGEVTIRTGANARAHQAARAPVTDTAAAVPSPEVARLEARLAELEKQLSAPVAAQVVPTSASGTRMSDAELLKIVRQLISTSEQRQEGVLARQIIQVSRDLEGARRADYARVSQGLMQLQGTAAETSHRQTALEYVVRTGLQR